MLKRFPSAQHFSSQVIKFVEKPHGEKITRGGVYSKDYW